MAQGPGLHVLPSIPVGGSLRATLPPGLGWEADVCPSLPSGGGALPSVLPFCSLPSESPLRTGWGARSCLPYGPRCRLSPPPAPVTWAGSPLPRPRATSLAPSPLLRGRAEPSGRSSHPVVAGRVGGRCARPCCVEPTLLCPPCFSGPYFPWLFIVISYWVSGFWLNSFFSP